MSKDISFIDEPYRIRDLKVWRRFKERRKLSRAKPGYKRRFNYRRDNSFSHEGVLLSKMHKITYGSPAQLEGETQYSLALENIQERCDFRRHTHEGGLLISFIWRGAYVDETEGVLKQYRAPALRVSRIDKHRVRAPKGFGSLRLFAIKS